MNSRVTAPLLARVYDPVMIPADRLFLGEYRSILADKLTGKILDLGAGTGAMIPYIAQQPDVESILAVEPDPAMRRRGRRRMTEWAETVEWVGAVGEHLPIRENTVDGVVSSLVLCTVADPDAVITEVARVLAPDGEFRVFEHVAADGFQGRFQHGIRPLWRRMAGGCHPDRATHRRLDESPNFEVKKASHIPIGVPPIRPFHLGCYRLSNGEG